MLTCLVSYWLVAPEWCIIWVSQQHFFSPTNVKLWSAGNHMNVAEWKCKPYHLAMPVLWYSWWHCPPCIQHMKPCYLFGSSLLAHVFIFIHAIGCGHLVTQNHGFWLRWSHGAVFFYQSLAWPLHLTHVYKVLLRLPFLSGLHCPSFFMNSSNM